MIPTTTMHKGLLLLSVIGVFLVGFTTGEEEEKCGNGIRCSTGLKPCCSDGICGTGVKCNTGCSNKHSFGTPCLFGPAHEE